MKINLNNKYSNQFVKVYDDVLNNQFCKKLIKSFPKGKWHEHTFYNEKTKKAEQYSGKDELAVLYYHDFNSDLKDDLMKRLWKVIHRYTIELDMPWYNQWNGYSPIRFNKYKKNKKMALHCDHITSLFTGEARGIPTLSLLGALNENYEGGEFIMFNDKTISLKSGQILIFPSNFMFPHKVEPVTKGTRYTFISWVY